MVLCLHALQKISQKLVNVKREIEEYDMLELLLSENAIEKFDEEYKKVEIKLFLSKKHDNSDAIFSIHAGQGSGPRPGGSPWQGSGPREGSGPRGGSGWVKVQEWQDTTYRSIDDRLATGLG